ncbi:hypothetical protein GCM10009000_080960 [Halobacterium noricense]|uniref:Uncharacterized protein n=1 Tax=Haladaptatus pallidirubidus TaxID=1008152 RepID=A0AAV3UAN1_9EURY
MQSGGDTRDRDSFDGFAVSEFDGGTLVLVVVSHTEAFDSTGIMLFDTTFYDGGGQGQRNSRWPCLAHCKSSTKSTVRGTL